METKALKTITEGSTTIHLTSSHQNKIKEVFYNPVQIFNRDISLIITKLHIKNIKQKTLEKKKDFNGINFYDALTASGLRAIRTLLELPKNYINNITACDLSESAQNIFNKNLVKNNCEKNKKISFICGDTKKALINTPTKEAPEIIDIDPYGSVVPFLYPALSTIKNGGLLCLTCTDTRVLFGSDRHKCFYLYRSARGGSDFKEEMGLRVLLQVVNGVANSLNKSFKVLLSVQSDFYVRVFLEVRNGRRKCWESIFQNGLFFYCKNCGAQHIERFGKKKDNGHFGVKEFGLESNKCKFCKGNFVLNGPVWLDPLYDPVFVQDLQNMVLESEEEMKVFLEKKNTINQEERENVLQIGTFKKIKGFLESVLAESRLYDNPKSFNYETLFSVKGVNVPKKLEFFSALKKRGYLAVSSYLHPLVFKTNAPDSVIYNMRLAWIKEWQKRVIIKNEKLKQNPNIKIDENIDNEKKEDLGEELKFDFSIDKDLKKSLKKKIARFLPNPEKNWGPKSGAVIIKTGDNINNLKKLKTN